MSAYPVRTLLFTALLALAACGTPKNNGQPNNSKTNGAFQYLKSDRPRSTPDAQAKADATTLAQDNTAFALDLYQHIRGQAGNLVLSPYSISAALAMTWGGARTATETDMATTLHFSLPQDRLHPAFNALDQELASRAQQAETEDGRGFALHIVNSIWGEKDHPFLPSYLDLLAENYGAGLRLLDFAGAPDASRQIINGWVSDETNARIKDLLPPGSILDTTMLVLVDAVYFNAAWAKPFEKGSTAPGTFHALDGSSPSVQMMSEGAELPYRSGAGWQAVEIPYEGDQLAMDVIVPDATHFSDYEGSFDAAAFQSVIASLQPAEVDLTFPKFTFSSRLDKLTQQLQAMGMASAFNGSADFSGMDGLHDLALSQVIHEGFIAVDESGTEAAAATAVTVVGSAAGGGNTVTLAVDRPFLFAIRDRGTGTVLFLGRVVNPS